MSAVAKSESLIHRDARLYCRRRHQKTMGKCAREERQGDALLTRQLRHIQKSKSYRERELDREQEKCLTDLVTIFDRQCQIATTRLARRLKDALGDKDIVDGLWGQRNAQDTGKPSQDDVKQAGRQSLRNGNALKSSDNHTRALPRGGAFTDTGEATSQKPGNNLSQLPSLASTGANFSASGLNRARPDSPRPSWHRAPGSTQPQPKPSLNQHQLFKHQIGIRESVQLNHTNQGVAKRPISGHIPTRPKTASQIGVNSWTTSRWDELASPIRCPQHSKDTSAHLHTARSLRCLLHENNVEDKTTLDAPEDVCFRRQYLACVMSRKLPVSGLRSGSFAQQNDVRKKMEARKRCMEELRMSSRQRAKSAPAGLVRMSLS